MNETRHSAERSGRLDVVQIHLPLRSAANHAVSHTHRTGGPSRWGQTGYRRTPGVETLAAEVDPAWQERDERVSGTFSDG
jgi:hypothetical protein